MFGVIGGIACCMSRGRLSIKTGQIDSSFCFGLATKPAIGCIRSNTNHQASSMFPSMTTLSASPTSLPLLSPYDARNGPIHTGVYKPLHEPSSSVKESLQSSQTTLPTSPPLRTQTRDKPNASPPPQSLTSVEEIGLSSSGLGFTPLNSTLASRVASISQLETCTVETALAKDVCDLYDRGRPVGHDHTALRRDRAFSAPEGTVDLDLQNKSIRVEGPGEDIGSIPPITSDVLKQKPTAHEWVSAICCVSDVLGAMLADDDRGAR